MNDLHLDFQEGAVTVVRGASGSGKSTMLCILGLLLKPTSGRVLVDGTDPHRLDDVARSRLRASAFGFVFQDACLDPARSIRANVLEPLAYSGGSTREAARRADELLERVGVVGRSDHRPGEVSGGQAQRVALCRALITKPPFVLADEPTGNLDPESGTEVLDVLHEAAREGVTVVIATHDPSVVARADREVVL